MRQVSCSSVFQLKVAGMRTKDLTANLFFSQEMHFYFYFNALLPAI
jgi:hypothetical protein